MKRLDTFLEGLLNKSNKTKVIGAKGLILSTIEDRLTNINATISNDTMMSLVDMVVNTYKRFKDEVEISKTPQCFICVYKNATRTWLQFWWLERNGRTTYWTADWTLSSSRQRKGGISAGVDKGDIYLFNRMCLIGTYEVPVEDMKEYLSKVEHIAGRGTAFTKLNPNGGSKIDKFIQHILS